jgi:hypothetical protein
MEQKLSRQISTEKYTIPPIQASPGFKPLRQAINGNASPHHPTEVDWLRGSRMEESTPRQILA